MLPDFSTLVEANGPAVVNIAVEGMMQASAEDEGPEQGNGPLGRFFRRYPSPPPRGGLVRGMGSGFIVSPDGVILTNAHVVAEANTVMVRLNDKREFRAKVVGVDRLSDVAVIRIDATGLPTVAIGDPQILKVGEWVLAIGSPYGFENTVTAGIISAKSRSLADESYVPYLQTDVAVNPGNSGGPLFNLRGEVIGMNSQIYSTTGGFMGLSFAIPIDIAVKVKDELLKHGKVTRGRLGVSVQDLTPQLAGALGIRDRRSGAVVAAVDPRGPAAKAGLQRGDVIVGIEGREISSSAELPARVADMKPGTSTTLDIIREGRPVRIQVPVAARPD